MINKTYDDLSKKTSGVNLRDIFLLITLLLSAYAFIISSHYYAAAFTTTIFLVLLSALLFKIYKKNKAEEKSIKTDAYKMMLNPSSCSEKFRDSATKYHIAALLTLGLFFTIAFCQSDDIFSSVFSFAGALTSVITITIAKSKKFSNLLYEKISKTIKMIVKFFKRKIPNTSFKNFIKLNQQPTEFIQFGIEHPPRTILA